MYTAQQSIYLAGDEKANIDEVYDQTTVNSRSRVESSQICLFVCVCVCVCVCDGNRKNSNILPRRSRPAREIMSWLISFFIGALNGGRVYIVSIC